MNREPIRPIYRPLADGSIPLYEGELDIDLGENALRASGRLELRLEPQVRLSVWVPGPASTNFFFTDDDRQSPDLTMTVASGSSLQPPTTERPEHKGSEGTFPVNPITSGRLETASCLFFHFGGALEARPSPGGFFGSQQSQIDFELPGWNLTLIAGDRETDAFCALVKAVPKKGKIDLRDVERLNRRLFLLLSFIANREVGAGVVAGLDHSGEVVWSHWAPPRINPQRAPIRWCPELLIGEALPMLGGGFSGFDSDEAMIEIIDRAIGYSLAANENVLDVKIPIACSGLELLSWAVLQRKGVMRTGDERRKLGPDGMLRLLLDWAGIPSAVPADMKELEHRRQQRCEMLSGGPEVLFNVRNGLVHPPKRLNDPEWPGAEEMFHAWQLATWYLELGLLRTLDYNGDYWSRLRLGRSAYDLEPVPWATNSNGDP